MTNWPKEILNGFDIVGVEGTLDNLSRTSQSAAHEFLGAMLEAVFIRREYNGSRYYAVLALQRLLNAPTEELDAFLGENMSCQDCYGEGVCGFPEGHCE